jgi:hypothetical protein
MTLILLILGAILLINLLVFGALLLLGWGFRLGQAAGVEMARESLAAAMTDELPEFREKFIEGQRRAAKELRQ